MPDEYLTNIGQASFDFEMSVNVAHTTSHQSTFFAEASPVRTLAEPENSPALTDHDLDFGESSFESLANYDPGTRSWKTSQTSFLETVGDGLVEFLATWPRSGMMQNGTAYQLPPLVPLTSVIGSSLWPTPTTVTPAGGLALCKWGGSRSRAKLRKLVTPEELNGPLNPDLPSWLMGFPTGWSNLTDTETP